MSKISSTSLARFGLAFLLLATLFKGLAWSIITPPWHANDEPQHFLYGQSVERFQTLRVEYSHWVPLEAQKLAEILQYDTVKERGKPFDLSDRTGLAEKIALLDDPEMKRRYVLTEDLRLMGVPNFTGFHPPLYYALLAIVQSALEETPILTRILASRWLSVAIGMVTVALAYAIGRELWPGRQGLALLLATLVSFHPMSTYTMTIVGNQALEITLFSACLLVSVQVIRRGMTARRGLLLSAFTALGLLTKISFLAILPMLGLLLLWQVVKLWRGRLPSATHTSAAVVPTNVGECLRHSPTDEGYPYGHIDSHEREQTQTSPLRTLLPWALLVIVPLLGSGWWYREAVSSGGNNLVSSYGLIVPGTSVQPLSYLVNYPWRKVYERRFTEYWGEFGWLFTASPPWLATLLTLICAVAVVGAIWWLLSRSKSRPHPAEPSSLFAVVFLGSATLAIVAFYTYVDFRMARDLGGRFGIQGRYFLPALAGQMAWLILGLTAPIPHRLQRACLWMIGAGMVTMNFYALFRTVGIRYYTVKSLLPMLERATVLQPVDTMALAGICVAFAVLSLALLSILWRLLVLEPKWVPVLSRA